jgi:hypothetical protein
MTSSTWHYLTGKHKTGENRTRCGALGMAADSWSRVTCTHCLAKMTAEEVAALKDPVKEENISELRHDGDGKIYYYDEGGVVWLAEVVIDNADGLMRCIDALQTRAKSADVAIDAVIARLKNLGINTDCYLELLAHRRQFPRPPE